MKKKNSSAEKQREKKVAKEKAKVAGKRQVEAVSRKKEMADAKVEARKKKSPVSRAKPQPSIDKDSLAADMQEQPPAKARDAEQLPILIRADTEEIKAARERINEIIDQLQGKSLIFRGESKDYGKITSGLYRHYWELRKENKSLDKKNFSAFDEMMLNIDEVRRNFPKETSDLGILTELQHQGGKTAFIDFTKKIHIALYFACNGHLDEDGRLFIFDKSGLKELDKKNFDKERKKKISDQDEIYWVNPVGSGIRVISQSSVFLYSKIGYLTAGRCKEKVIEKSLKAGILGLLDKFHEINEAAIYNDLQGFIKRDSNKYADFYRGYSLQSRGDYEKAIQYYGRMLEIDPLFAEAYLDRGIAKVNLGNHEEAIEDYSRALEINSKYAAEVYRRRGILKAGLGKHKEAIEDCDKALEINPKYAFSYRIRGISKAALGRYKEAIEDCDKALEINPEYAEVYRRRGILKASLGRNEEAIEDYGLAMESNPEYAEACRSRGILKASLGRHEEAIEDFDNVLEINSEDIDAFSRRGIAKEALGKYEEAIEDYDQILRIKPKHAHVYNNRGLAKAALGRHEEAIKDYDKTLKAHPKYVWSYNNRGNSNIALQNYTGAIKDYDKVLKINPEDAYAYYFRSFAKAALKRYEEKEVVSDLQKALNLYQKKGNDAQVKEIEGILSNIEKILSELRNKK